MSHQGFTGLNPAWGRLVRERLSGLHLLATALGAAALALVAAACGSTSVTEVSGPTALRCVATAAVPSSPLPFDGGRTNVAVNSARECEWTLASDTSWLVVTPSAGVGASEVTLTAAANGDAIPRTGVLNLNDQRITLTQEPAPCRWELGQMRASVGADGGTVVIPLSTLIGCPWTATPTEGWLRVPRSSGTGPAQIDVSVQANPGGVRSAEVMVAGFGFIVTQGSHEAAPAPAPAPPDAPPPPPETGPTPIEPAPILPLPPLPPLLPPDDDDDGDGKDKRKRR
jgi:hypothetical protein